MQNYFEFAPSYIRLEKKSSFHKEKETLQKWEKLCRKSYSKHIFYFCMPFVEMGQREANNINPVQSKNM